jgi:glycosyltransferase involved in cell wall biosynthesis
MLNNLLFSIVIPTYNRASFIEKTINSVLNQVYPNFEIIVVDDGSTDHTEEIVRSIKDPRISYYKKKNEERAKARNFGANLAKGDYINFLDSDDTLYPNHLSEAINLIRSVNAPEIFHLNYDIKNPVTNITEPVKITTGDINLKLVERGNLLSCNGVFLRKDIALRFPFNEDIELSASEDYELWLRLAARYKIHYSNTITSSLINHDLRSVLNFKKEKLIKRLNLFVHYIYSDEEFTRKYGNYKSLMISYTQSYISLHIALTGKNKLTALQFLLKSMLSNMHVVSTRRFYSIIFKILTKY